MAVARISVASRVTSVHQVRQWLAAELRSTPSEETRADALLVMSEVVTNAVRHGGGGAIGISVSRLRGVLRAQVRDESSGIPIRHEAGEDGGWGLDLIDLLTDRWGVDQHPGDGKTVWFEIDDTGVQAAP